MQEELEEYGLVLLRDNDYGKYILGNLRRGESAIKIEDRLYQNLKDWENYCSGPADVDELTFEMPYVSFSKANDPVVRINIVFAKLSPKVLDMEGEGFDDLDALDALDEVPIKPSKKTKKAKKTKKKKTSDASESEKVN